jgi:hypothetical protein
MTTDRAKEFQVRITKEAIALLVIHGESVSAAASTEDISVAHFEQAVTLIGKAWNLPAEATMENISLIQKERDALRRIAAGEDVPHVLPEGELPMNATGMETLDNVWDLFETAVQMDSREQRMAMFKLASKLAECQNLLDWIEKTAAERELPEIAAD